MAGSSALPRARTAVFTAVCLTLAGGAHASAAGHGPGLPGLVLGGLVVFVLANRLSRRERSLAEILVALFAAQTALHALFDQLATAAPHAVTGAAAGPHAPGPHVHDAQPSVTMTLAHTAAGLIAAYWLRRGEATAWNLARRLAAPATRVVRTLLALLAVRPGTTPVRVPWPASGRPLPGPTGVLRHAVHRRGPPEYVVIPSS